MIGPGPGVDFGIYQDPVQTLPLKAYEEDSLDLKALDWKPLITEYDNELSWYVYRRSQELESLC